MFGQQMLAALEKSDADHLALLIPTLLQGLLNQQGALYQAQIDEVNAQILSLQASQTIQTARQQFYSSHAQQLDNDQEKSAIVNWQAEVQQYGSVMLLEGLATIMALVPDFDLGATGFGGTPHAKVSKYGGSNFTSSLGHGASTVRAGASSQDRQATIQHTLGGYQQRADLWNLQAQEASTTFQQLGNLIDAAKARLTVRTQQQADWQTTIANLQKQIDFMTGKFTNQQLYDWMSNTLYNLYLQAYNLAYGIAKGAEHCYRYELVLPNASFIQFNYWNSLYQGLLAGEGLMTDLLSMQSSYLSLNARRYEISRIYSLAKLKPLALIQLLQTGACDFSIDEPHFDEDYPGHYQRQLKRVSITVVYPSPGKNDNVSCTLTLVANKVRMNASLNLPYPETPPSNDPRFAYQYGAVQTIVTSQAQDDPGLFENQIHYQVTDPRYLPFEGAGAISDWHMELPSTNEIDVTTVGDVQIHLLYTALDGGPLLQQAAIASLAAKSQGSKMFMPPTISRPRPQTRPIRIRSRRGKASSRRRPTPTSCSLLH